MSTLADLTETVTKNIQESAINRVESKLATASAADSYITIQNSQVYEDIRKDTLVSLSKIKESAKSKDLQALAEKNYQQVSDFQLSDLPKKKELFNAVIAGFREHFQMGKFRQARYYLVVEK